MSDPLIGIGIIGCGNVLEAYVPVCQRLEARRQARIVMACGRAPQLERARALGITNLTTDEKDVLENPAVSVVLILTSMPEHSRLVEAALRAGKHVVVEKPLATDFQAGRRLVQLARERQRHLVCAPFTTLSPTYQAISNRVRRGEIGKPCLARSRYGWAGPWWNEWFYQKGGGCLPDLGVYGITTLTGILGPARRVSAMSGVAIPQREINGRLVESKASDNAQLLLDFGNACFAVVTTGFTMQQYRSPALEIYGTTGTVQMLGDDWDPDGYELWQNSRACWQVFKETQPDWLWTAGLPHLIECLHSGTKPTLSPEHALHVLEILSAAETASREERVVALETTFDLSPLSDASQSQPEAVHLDHDRTREHRQ